MGHTDLTAAVETEGRRMLDAIRRDPGRTVPQYPQWTLADLAAHMGGIHGFVADVIGSMAQERVPRPTLPEGREPIEWAEEQHARAVAALGGADPSAPVWGFSTNSNVDRWARRMVVETGVHRWDAELPFDEPEPLPELVAVTALDEFPEMWMRFVPEGTPTLEARVVDLGRSWVYGAGEPELTVEGTASDVYLALMMRPSPVALPAKWVSACAALPPPPDLG
ncbi:MAG: maleylpyruvate isomerase family mycothiol-dependent enzyme [Actinomycetes bacterium]|jgi:uncharacterized protein (TIGR03083 family)